MRIWSSVAFINSFCKPWLLSRARIVGACCSHSIFLLDRGRFSSASFHSSFLPHLHNLLNLHRLNLNWMNYASILKTSSFLSKISTCICAVLKEILFLKLSVYKYFQKIVLTYEARAKLLLIVHLHANSSLIGSFIFSIFICRFWLSSAASEFAFELLRWRGGIRPHSAFQ